MLSGVLQKKHPFRKDSYEKETDLYLRPDEEGETYTLHRLLEKKSGVAIPHLLNKISPDCGAGISVWGFKDDEAYMIELKELAETMGMDLQNCARTYGTLTLPDSTNGWEFHPALGFVEHQ